MQGNETAQNGVIRVRVSDLLFALQKRWMIIVALSLVGLTFGMILSAMTVVQTSYQTYNVNGSFAVTSKNINGQYVGGYSVPNTNDFHLAEDMVDAVRYVMRSERVLNEVINENELLGYTVTTLRNAITVSQYNSTQILEMRITWRNAEEGLAVWYSVLQHASDILPETLQLGSLEIINEPKAEQIGVVGGGNNRVVLLTLLGFAAGVGFAVIELLMHPTLNNVRDVEQLFGVETIGVIPHDNEYYKRKDSMMTRDDAGNSLVVQNFSAAAYILRNRLGTREEHHCFYVTSAIAGEGKTTVAANLAIQLSDMEHKTLLIDFDTRNPALGALFLNKVDYEHSLNALYRGDVLPEEAITTLSGYLDLLPAVLEHNAINVDNMLVELVENLKQKYEYVILDAPPVGLVSGTLSLNQVASSVLFVIGYDNSSLPEIQSSLEKLDKSGTRVLGCVVNNVISGRAIGMTPTADERKKNISKKAAKKNKEAERFGFADKADGDQSPEEVQKTKSGRRKRKKKETAPALSSETKAKPDEVVLPAVTETKKRNVYEDSIEQEETKKTSFTTQETINELVRMGLTNEWGDDQTDGQMNDTADGGETETPDTAKTEESVLEPSEEPAADKPEAVEADWIDLSESESSAETPENGQAVFKELSKQFVSDIPEEQAPSTVPAPAAEKHAVRSVNVKRKSVHTVSQSAAPRQIVITKRGDKAAATVKPAEKSAESSVDNRAAAAEFSPIAQNAPAAPEAAKAVAENTASGTGKKRSGARSMIVMVIAVALLALAALVLAVAAVAGFAYGFNGISAMLHTYTELADRLAAGGLSLSAIVLGILLLMLGSRIFQQVIPSIIRSAKADGNKGRGKEEKK